MPRRPCGPPRNDNGFLSFRGQCAHWSWESVLFTMDGGVGRPTKDEGNGTPSRRALRKAQLITRASRRAAKRPRPRPRGMGGNCSRDYPQRGHQRRTIPQSRLRHDSSLYTREPCPAGDGGCGLPRRPVGPPRNGNGFLSFRGAKRRGNPLPFTMDGGSGRRGRRPLRKARSTTQASRRAAKRPRPRPRGIGGNRRKDHPKRGTAPAAAQAALSEAESAGRAAGQIRVLPDDLRVQHGAPGSEISAKPRPCSRRSYVH